MKISNTIKIKSGKELKLYGGQKHSNKNTIRYFCEHADYFYEHREFIFDNSRMFLITVYQDRDFIYTLGGLLEWLESITQVATISEVIKDVLFQKDNSDRLSRLKQHCSRYSKAAGEYEHLTLKNVHDTITSLVKQREHNLTEKRIWSPYIDNIELLYEHRNEILAHKEWAMATIPLKVYMVCQPICIGTMLRLWANENEWLTYQCECGHKAFIYSFAGSPLSGTTSISYKCIHCHKNGNAQVGSFLSRAHTLALTQQELFKEAEGDEAITLTELLDNIKTINLK